MKLEELLDEELYAQVKAKIDAANANEPDELNHVRYADLSEGKYMSKERHNSEMEQLQAALSGKETELSAANELIAQLKKGTKGDEELQGKITTYETQVQELQEQLQATKVKAAIKVALLSEKAVDVDYLTYKLNEKLKESGEKLELDENDNIKGWDSKLDSLKTQFPTMFSKAADDGGFKRLDDGKLPEGDNHGDPEPKDLADALRQKYETEKKE